MIENRWNCSGLRVPFGSGNTPVWLGLTRRFSAWTGREVARLFLPIHGLPTTLAQNRPREASPTGKSRMGIASYSVAYQPVEEARTKTYIMTSPDPIYKDTAHLITRGVIDPYASQIRDPNQQTRGLKWFG